MLQKKSLLVVSAVVLALLFLGQTPGFGQSDPPFQFTAYGDGPVLEPGGDGEWNSGGMFGAQVLYVDDTFHMFYWGGEGPPGDTPVSIGYASSPDGFTWTEYEDNPVLTLDPEFSTYGPLFVTAFFDGEQWRMFFDWRNHRNWFPSPNTISATAAEPTGPWEVNTETVVESDPVGSWDSTGIAPMTIHQVGDTMRLYYSGYRLQDYHLGLVTSTNGVEWTKYQDPTTDDRLFRESDPVFTPGGDANECDSTGSMNLFTVVQRDDTWELLYGGVGPDEEWGFCYVTSEDGIHWSHQSDFSVFDPPMEYFDNPLFPSALVVDDTYYLYYSVFPISGIWLATAPVPAE